MRVEFIVSNKYFERADHELRIQLHKAFTPLESSLAGINCTTIEWCKQFRTNPQFNYQNSQRPWNNPSGAPLYGISAPPMSQAAIQVRPTNGYSSSNQGGIMMGVTSANRPTSRSLGDANASNQKSESDMIQNW